MLFQPRDEVVWILSTMLVVLHVQSGYRNIIIIPNVLFLFCEQDEMTVLEHIAVIIDDWHPVECRTVPRQWQCIRQRTQHCDWKATDTD